MANGLDIMNRGNRPTFVTSNRQKVIDITIATLYAGNFIKEWHVTEEVKLFRPQIHLIYCYGY